LENQIGFDNVDEKDYFMVTVVTCANPTCAKDIIIPGGIQVTKGMHFYCPTEIKNGIILKKCLPNPPNWREIFKGVKAVVCDEDADQLNRFCDAGDGKCDIEEPKPLIEPKPMKINIQLLSNSK
jgi:hypothetical protein